MNWKEKLKTVLEALGFKAKFDEKSLTNEEFQQILDAYQRDYQVTLQDDINAEATQAQNEQQQQMLNQIYSAVLAAGGEQTVENQSEGAHDATQQDIVAAINNLASRMERMSRQPAEDVPETQGRAVIVSIHGFGNTPEYLFGAQAPMYSMGLRWNRIAANPGMASALGAPSDDEYRAFQKAVCDYGHSLMQRARYLIENKMTADLKALAAGEFSTNYAGVDSLGDMGTQFTVRRQDAIIARVLATVKMTDFFPVRYGIQDNDVIFNAFFDEVSQAWQPGTVYKGGMKIENERGYVDDAMIKMAWGPMKELERKYIAYLNTSGSDPIKWNMVEYQMLNTLLEAQREQNIRRMRGIYVAPETGVAGSYLHASTGIQDPVDRRCRQDLPLVHREHHAHRRTAVRRRGTQSPRRGRDSRRQGTLPERASQGMVVEVHPHHLPSGQRFHWCQQLCQYRARHRRSYHLAAVPR